MEDLSQIVTQYTTRYNEKIKTITAPLHDHLKIFSYLYFKIEEDGRFVTLSNYPEQLEYYYHKKFYIDNPYLVHPQLLKSGSVFTNTTSDEKYHATVVHSRNRFDMDNTFLMLEKVEGQVEGFLYATHSGQVQPHHYLEYIELLKRFNRYFVKETAPLLGKMRAEGFNLHRAKGAKFLERKEGLPLESKNDKEYAFLKAIFPLSPQERRCLELFRQGNSAQATAAIMQISRRTVEHYFDSIKSKLGCHSKWDLLQIG